MSRRLGGGNKILKQKSTTLIFLGSGSAFTVGVKNYHSNILLVNDNSKLLIDCGSDARLSLHELGYSAEDIDDVYISHLHADHVGGLEWLGFKRKFSSMRPKPILHISEKLVNCLWNNVLSGGMKCLENKESALDDFFEVRAIYEWNNHFRWQEIMFQLVKTIHVQNHRKNLPSYGLFFNYNNQKILITTDTKFSPALFMNYYLDADIIFHDCELLKQQSGVHAHYDEIRTLDASIKNKMWLYHYNPGPLPDAVADGFKGFVKKGQSFIL